MTWLQDHRDDKVPVRLIDLLSLLARLEQVQVEQTIWGDLAHDRIWSEDLPRLKKCVPAEGRAMLKAVVGFSPPDVSRETRSSSPEQNH